MTFNASSGPPYHLNITLNFHITCICFHAGFVSLTEYISRSKGASQYNNHQLPSTASHRNTPNTYHSEASTSTAQTEITVLNGDDDSPHRLEAEKPQHSIMQVVPSRSTFLGCFPLPSLLFKQSHMLYVKTH